MSFKLLHTLFRKSPLVLLLGAAFLFSFKTFGAELVDSTGSQNNFLAPVDSQRDYLSGRFVSYVKSIDRFFGDDRNYLESNKSVLQLDITRAVGRGAERKFVLSGRAKIHLPSTEKQLNVLLESSPDQNVTGEQAKIQATPIDQVAAPESFAAAARYENAIEKRAHYSADAGIKFQGLNTSPFARVRGRYSLTLDAWHMRAAETFFWFNTTGVGSTTELNFERPISDPMLFRAGSNATWLRDTGNFDLRQDISVFHTMDERSAMLYQASAIGVSRPKLQVTEYVLLMLFRYRLHRKWVFLELSPQLHFPKTMNYRSTPLFVMRLEFLFDDTK
ncbi:MAG: hypothetical protein R8M11_05660 [Gallionella sp.]